MDFTRVAVRQAIGQKRIFDLIESEARSNDVVPQAFLIKQMHGYLMKDVEGNEAGQYRTSHRFIKGSKVMTSMPSLILLEVNYFAAEMERKLRKGTPSTIEETIILAATSYHNITRIHPFADGNGRVARLYMNYVCRMKALPYICLPKAGAVERMSSCLKQADAGNIQPLVNLCGRLMFESVQRVREYHNV